MSLLDFRRIVVIAPHPDDETLGAGGTIARFTAAGADVSVLIVSGHLPPLYPEAAFEETRREAEDAFRVLGVKNFDFLRIPATMVHTTPVAELNGKVVKFVRAAAPEMVLIPYPDRHIDHRIVFDSAVVATRPVGQNPPRLVMCYETLSETHWNAPGIEPAFVPDFHFDISTQMEKKIQALECYASQVKAAPSRSVEATRALARFRGSQMGCEYAEAFKVVRAVF